jgi:Ca2+-binding RTX toxin-like protein
MRTQRFAVISAVATTAALALAAIAIAQPIKGTQGDDVLTGTEADDRMVAKKGNDQASGQAGNDDITGNKGDDLLNGDDGDDTLTGNQGADEIDGGTGSDLIKARGDGKAADTITCGEDPDGLDVDTVLAHKTDTVDAASCEVIEPVGTDKPHPPHPPHP